jgi:hypothetical protein
MGDNNIWIALTSICVLSEVSSLILEEAHATASEFPLGLVTGCQRFTCLATDPNDLWQDFFGKYDPAEYETQGSSFIECLFYPNLDSLSGFKWTGPDPLSDSTRASDIFVHVSAFLFPKEVH